MALWNLPHPLAMLGEIAVAARLMAFAARFWERGIGPLSASDHAIVEEERKRTAKRLGARRAAALRLEGEALSLADAVELALTGRD